MVTITYLLIMLMLATYIYLKYYRSCDYTDDSLSNVISSRCAYVKFMLCDPS